MEVKYKVAAYMRLSQEDEGKEISDSIISQKNIIENKIKELGNEFKIEEYYADDGYTGLNTNRPAFQKMIEDLKQKKVNTVITKDLSRLSRNSFEANYLIEIYFLENNIRYISVLDDVDTQLKKSNNEIIQFKTLINDWYSKDISKKIKSSIWARKEKGMYVASTAPYGYIKDTKDKHKLIINIEEANVIKKIFEKYNSGKSIKQIAKMLEEAKITRPISRNCVFEKEKYKWSEETIRRILSNNVYIGNTEYGKRINLSYKSRKVKYIPQSEWKIVYNTHKPIIEKELFENVQKRRMLESKIKNKKYEWRLNGVLYCDECQSKMFLKVIKKEGKIYSQKIYCLNGSRNKCKRKSKGIDEKAIDYIAFKELRNYIEKVIDIKELYTKVIEIYEKESQKYNLKINYEKELKKIGKEIKILYDDYKKGLLMQSDYENFYKEKDKRKNELQMKIVELETEKNKRNISKNTILTLYNQTLENKAFASKIIKTIKIDIRNKIIINYNFIER